MSEILNEQKRAKEQLEQDRKIQDAKPRSEVPQPNVAPPPQEYVRLQPEPPSLEFDTRELDIPPATVRPPSIPPITEPINVRPISTPPILNLPPKTKTDFFDQRKNDLGGQTPKLQPTLNAEQRREQRRQNLAPTTQILLPPDNMVRISAVEAQVADAIKRVEELEDDFPETGGGDGRAGGGGVWSGWYWYGGLEIHHGFTGLKTYFGCNLRTGEVKFVHSTIGEDLNKWEFRYVSDPTEVSPGVYTYALSSRTSGDIIFRVT